jgi:hypothetical protein
LFEARELLNLDPASAEWLPIIVTFIVSGVVGITCIHFPAGMAEAAQPVQLCHLLCCL